MKKKIIISVAAIVAICGLIFALNQNNSGQVVIVPTPLPSATTSVYSNEEWLNSKKMNDEYVGRIHFESGLIDEQIVQAEDNEKYLQLSWDNQQTSHGSVFMDYRNSISDQNIILYGHFVYADESLIFSPLHQLILQENYMDNKVIQLDLENERRNYEVISVFYYEMDNPTLEYFHPNYEQNYFQLYMDMVKQKEFYSTGNELSMNDKFLTLQTCVRDRDDLRLIVLAKLVEE